MTWVAFLRAINVGGKSLVTMRELGAAFAAAGCAEVRTIGASGNVVFEAARADGAVWRARIQRSVAGLLPAAPAIVYRSIGELEALVEAEPFGALADDGALKLYVVFTLEAPQRPPFPLRLPKEGLEAVGIRGRDVLVVSRRKPNGIYGFPNNWIEQQLGVTSTARNWSTVRKVVAAARAHRSRHEPAR